MAYVDLNPVRAKMTQNVETSEYTSAYERIHGVVHQGEKDTNYPFEKKVLLGFVGDSTEPALQDIPFSLLDYIELIDWSGRIIRDDKRGAIAG